MYSGDDQYADEQANIDMKWSNGKLFLRGHEDITRMAINYANSMVLMKWEQGHSFQ